MMIISRWVFDKFGWGMAALITPTVLLITGEARLAVAAGAAERTCWSGCGRSGHAASQVRRPPRIPPPTWPHPPSHLPTPPPCPQA